MTKTFLEKALRKSIKEELRPINEDKDVLADAMSDDIEEIDDISQDDQALVDGMEKDIDDSSSSLQMQSEEIQQAMEEQKSQVDKTILEWVNKCEDFVDWLNNPKREGSVRFIINNAVEGTTMSKISGPDQRRINKISTEIAAFAQSLRSYIGGVKEGSV